MTARSTTHISTRITGYVCVYMYARERGVWGVSERERERGRKKKVSVSSF